MILCENSSVKICTRQRISSLIYVTFRNKIHDTLYFIVCLRSVNVQKKLVTQTHWCTIT